MKASIRPFYIAAIAGCWLLGTSLAFWSPATCTARRKPLSPLPAKTTTVQEEIEQLMRDYDPILLYASRLLPPSVAVDVAALYAWCRRLDEITDNPNSTKTQIQQQLDDWQHRFDLLSQGQPVDAMDQALYECLQRHPDLTTQPFRDMMHGMRADAVDPPRTIPTLAELETYAYQVAGTVGLLLLPLWKAPPESKEPAVALGTAIQLINILRDATPDAALGRVYLPLDLLHAHGVVLDDVLQLQLHPQPQQQPSSEGYRTVVRLVASRAQVLLEQAQAGKKTLPGWGMQLMVQIIIELYRGYLEQLERIKYDNLIPGGERVKISTVRKLSSTIRALGVILQGK